MSSLVTHYENHLGRIHRGFRYFGTQMPFQVIECRGGKQEGIATFATLGLSEHPLRSRETRRELFVEFTLCARESFGARNIPGVLFQLGMEVIESGSAPLRGMVIGPRGQLFEGTAASMEALYLTVPVCFDAAFSKFETLRKRIAMIWLVPITTSEAKLVAAKGWSAFEDLLESAQPDLFDFHRESVANL